MCWPDGSAFLIKHAVDAKTCTYFHKNCKYNLPSELRCPLHNAYSPPLPLAQCIQPSITPCTVPTAVHYHARALQMSSETTQSKHVIQVLIPLSRLLGFLVPQLWPASVLIVASSTVDSFPVKRRIHKSDFRNEHRCEKRLVNYM